MLAGAASQSPGGIVMKVTLERKPGSNLQWPPGSQCGERGVGDNFLLPPQGFPFLIVLYAATVSVVRVSVSEMELGMERWSELE